MALRANAIANSNEPINGKIAISYTVSIVDTVNPTIGVRFNTSILLTGDEQPAQIESSARGQIIIDASSPGNGSIVLGTNDIRFS